MFFGHACVGQDTVVQFLKLLSPATVVAVDTSPTKRKLAADLGADATLDPDEVEVAEEIKSMTDGEGAQAVLGFVGIDATLSTAAGSVGRQGIVSILGLGGGVLPFSFMGIPSEATVIGSAWGSRNDLAEVIALAQKGELADTSESHPLDEINTVFDRLRDGQIKGRAVLVP